MCETSAPRFDEAALILGNQMVGPRLYVLSLQAPRMAGQVKPGQFVHLQIPGYEAHILRRPFSILSAEASEGTLEILYQTVGEGTTFMTSLVAGQTTSILGPLGRGWDVREGRSLVVGGGVGAAPVFMLTEQLLAAGYDPVVVLGAQSQQAMVTLERYRNLLGHDPILATDDGSLGIKGFCTLPVADLLSAGGIDRVYCCGPEPLMRSVAKLAEEAQVECWVSMERRMACGVGACLSCVVETTQGKKRSCVDGPVFNAKDVVW